MELKMNSNNISSVNVGKNTHLLIVRLSFPTVSLMNTSRRSCIALAL